MFVIGRTADAELQIDAMIGGRRTFGVYWNAPHWELKINHEAAIAVVDGERIEAFESEPLRNHSVVEIRHAQTQAPLHRFRVELG